MALLPNKPSNEHLHAFRSPNAAPLGHFGVHFRISEWLARKPFAPAARLLYRDGIVPSPGRPGMIEDFAKYGYVGIFCAIIATGFGLPMPEELPVLFSGVLVGHADTLTPGMTELPPDRLRWWIMLPVVILAVVVGDGLLYGVGRLWGPRLLGNAWRLPAHADLGWIGADA